MKVCRNLAWVASMWLLGVAPVAFAQAPAGVTPAVDSRPSEERVRVPASEFDLAWQQEMPEAVMLHAVGYFLGMVAQLERIEKTIPALASESKEAAERLRTLFSPGVESMKAEWRRRDPEAYERASRDLEASIRAEIEKIELTEKIARDAYNAGRWEPNRLPGNVVAPVLAFSPRHLSAPAAVMEDGLTALLCQPIPGTDDKRVCALIPRSWSTDKNRAPKESVWWVRPWGRV